MRALLAILLFALAAGCASPGRDVPPVRGVPPGYDADVTPGRDGADLIGGAP